VKREMLTLYDTDRLTTGCCEHSDEGRELKHTAPNRFTVCIHYSVVDHMPNTYPDSSKITQCTQQVCSAKGITAHANFHAVYKLLIRKENIANVLLCRKNYYDKIIPRKSSNH
jgi:hypothetical protein